MIDEPYYSIAAKFLWRSSTTDGKKYFFTYVDGKRQSISKMVFQTPPNHIVYHKNGINEDFTNDNIIVCSRHDVWNITDNKPGTASQYYYVSWFKSHGKWGVEQERNEGVRKRWMFHEEIEAALWADYRNRILLKSDRKLNFPDMSQEQLQDMADGLIEKYGYGRKEKHSKTRQGNSYCKKKTTPYIGVSKQGNKYVAQICHLGKKIIICRVDDPVTAAKAYDKKAIELFGNYAKTNGV